MFTLKPVDFVRTETALVFRVSLRCVICAGLFCVMPVLADDPPGDVTDPTPIEGAKQVFMDPADDRALRRTDDDPSVDPLTGNWPELRYATLGHWIPVDAYADPYFGNYSTNGDCNTNCDFLRLDMVFDGLLNPPGDVTVPYTPAQYGPNPLFGWVEIDVDANHETGGDTDQPGIMYCANVARWGGVPQGAWFEDRISTDGEPWSGTFGALPATYRSGEEFFLLFQGDYINSIDKVVGDADNVFEEDETWLVNGALFWGAPGYIPVIYGPGYQPDVTIRFKHSTTDGTTTLSFVYSLDNQAHAKLYNDWPVQDYNFSSSDANSVDEALWDLEISADDPPYPSHPNNPLLEGWATQNRQNHLDPWGWRCTVLFGTALDSPAQGDEVFAWTDAWPNVVVNDFNGDGLVTKTDRFTLNDYIAEHDGETGYDADGSSTNGEIDRQDFSDRFSVHDDDYDGLINTNGFPNQGPCDYDNDGDVDLDDFRAFQVCYSTTPLDPEVLANVGCLDAFDDDEDLNVDLDDYVTFVSVMNGPG